jgi:hypothetical protein
MEEPDSSDDDCGLEWNAEKGVSPSAMMLEGSDGAIDGPEDVEVGGFGSDRHGDRSVGCLAVEPGAGEADSGHQVGYGFHSVAGAFQVKFEFCIEDKEQATINAKTKYRVSSLLSE